MTTLTPLSAAANTLIQNAFSKLGSTKTCSLGTGHKKIQIILKEHFKKFFVIGACFFLLYPETLPARLAMGPSAELIELPAGSTVTSIISKIVEHGDLRDSGFVVKLLGVSPTNHKSFFYAIKPDYQGFSFSYTTPNHGDYYGTAQVDAIVVTGFGHITQNVPCIKYSDFQSLFDVTPETPPSQRTGIMNYVFKKDIDKDFYLTLNIMTVDGCAEVIRAAMFEKTTNNPK